MAARPAEVLTVSVVVPTWREAARIGEQVRRLRGLDVLEVLVADGGSDDGTGERAAAAGARVIRSARGRGPQLQAGAAAALGDVLWFVHADVRVPDDGPAQIRAALADRAVVGGAFRTRTVDDVAGRWPRLLRLADFRATYTRTPYGDQAIFCRRDVWSAVSGFPDEPLFEDLVFSRRLRRAGELRVLRGPVVVSGRRFLHRPLRSLFLMNAAPVAWRLGMPARLLARWYGHPR